MMVEFVRQLAGRAVLGLLVLVMLVVGTQSAIAQDAGITGQVLDESGAALPGVTVTAKSPALQVPEVTAVTDGRGEYRLTPLPIGTYDVSYELPGLPDDAARGAAA